MAKVESACPGHAESITQILEKLQIHIPKYRDIEEFYVMCYWAYFGCIGCMHG